MGGPEAWRLLIKSRETYFPLKYLKCTRHLLLRRATARLQFSPIQGICDQIHLLGFSIGKCYIPTSRDKCFHTCFHQHTSLNAHFQSLRRIFQIPCPSQIQLKLSSCPCSGGSCFEHVIERGICISKSLLESRWRSHESGNSHGRPLIPPELTWSLLCRAWATLAIWPNNVLLIRYCGKVTWVQNSEHHKCHAVPRLSKHLQGHRGSMPVAPTENDPYWLRDLTKYVVWFAAPAACFKNILFHVKEFHTPKQQWRSQWCEQTWYWLSHIISDLGCRSFLPEKPEFRERKSMTCLESVGVKRQWIFTVAPLQFPVNRGST